MTIKRLLLLITLLLFISHSHCQLSTNQEILDRSAAITQEAQELAKQVNQLEKELQALNKRVDDLVLDSLLNILYAINIYLE